jgi:regulator of sirC expression with transglutaminase-like and TPR domain
MKLPEDRLPLDEAALLISACANPTLDVQAQLLRLDEVSKRVGVASVSALLDVMFEQLGLRGEREHFDDPLNSYIDQVLERRRGIPISLSVLLIEIGRRCGVTLEAVGMPGHFLVRDPAAPDRLIDAFNQGRRLDHSDCERLLSATVGVDAQLTPDMLATTGPLAILSRMLANLDRSFERRRDRASLSWVSDLRMKIPNSSLGDRTHLATRLAALGRLDDAAAVLEEAAGVEPGSSGPQVRDKLLAEASALRARLN